MVGVRTIAVCARARPGEGRGRGLVWKLLQIPSAWKANLEPGVLRSSTGEVARVRIKEDHVVATHEGGHVRKVVDRVESEPEATRRAAGR